MKRWLATMTVVALALWPSVGRPCDHIPGSHGHIGAGAAAWDFSLGLRAGGGLRLLLGLAHVPCCQPPVVVAPQVVMAPPPVGVSPPPMVVAPQPVVVVPPVVVAAPAPAPAPVVVARGPETPERPDYAPFAVKWAPMGWSSSEPLWSGVDATGVREARSIGLEYRLSRRWALRSDLEYGSGALWDVAGVKLSPLSGWFSPYASASVSGHSSPIERSGRVVGSSLEVGLVGALGVDLRFGRHFFLEGEGRYRVRSESCRDVPQYSALVGGGVAF